MFGFAIGAIGALGLMALVMKASRMRRWHHHHAMYSGGFGGGPYGDDGPSEGPWGRGGGWHGHGGGWHGHGGGWHGHRGAWGGRGWNGGAWAGGGWGGWGSDRFERFAREGLRRHLRLREEQEEVVASAIRDVGKALEGLILSVKDSRDDVGKAFRGETLDEVRLSTVFQGHDADLAEARASVVAALKKAHDVLDPEQRGKIADLLASGGGRWV